MASSRVRDLVRAAEAAASGNARIAHLCAMASAGLPVDGVGLSVTGGPGRQSTVTSTDQVSGQIEDLQVLLGQGPCVDAVATGVPVLVPDLHLPSVAARWPAFAPAAAAAGAGASFAVPLVVGDVRLGAMDLYRAEAGALARDDVEEAKAYADAVVELLLALEHSEPPDQLPESLRVGWMGSSVVHQASGMIMVQLGCDVAAAFAALRARAYREDRSLYDVALNVIERRVRFDGTSP
jgi:hypothetical protein